MQENGTSWLVESRKAQKLVKKLLPPSYIFDVGGADGVFARSLLGYAVDWSDKDMDLNGPWTVDLEKYEAVTAWSVLEHLENPSHFFREAYKVLKPNGLLLLPYQTSAVGRAANTFYSREIFKGTRIIRFISVFLPLQSLRG